MCYYGLSFASTSLSTGGPYMNFMLRLVIVSSCPTFCSSVLIEIPGYIFAILVIDSWGRKSVLSVSQIVSGLACILCGLLQGHEDPAVHGLQVDPPPPPPPSGLPLPAGQVRGLRRLLHCVPLHRRALPHTNQVNVLFQAVLITCVTGTKQWASVP